MFCCGFCRKEYLLYSNLCPKCDKIYKLGTIYGFDKIYDIVDKSLVIPQDNKLDKIVIRKKSV